ncbi:unnamed protein product [Pleuronectes platessa]|uniref:Uncharacterized protein n=1 Tax=Pleuronectes platessa TaxID=8262 RepID=A0A9N7UUK5_PLEPL|nr:unnamed protein product [Pleuronectes platessa]
MEEELAKHLKQLADQFHGLAPVKCRELAFEYAEKNNIPVPANWTEKQWAGQTSRQPEPIPQLLSNHQSRPVQVVEVGLCVEGHLVQSQRGPQALPVLQVGQCRHDAVSLEEKMSAWESKAEGPVWRSRSGEDGRTVPEQRKLSLFTAVMKMAGGARPDSCTQ